MPKRNRPNSRRRKTAWRQAARDERLREAEELQQAAAEGVPTASLVLADDQSNLETTRDLQIINRLLESHDWEIPDLAFENIPKRLFLIASNKRVNIRTNQAEEANYSPQVQVRASQVLAALARENRMRMVSAARLQQIHDGKAAEQHLHLHREQVIIMLPHNGRDSVPQAKIAPPRG